jgi:hypothetical protein
LSRNDSKGLQPQQFADALTALSAVPESATQSQINIAVIGKRNAVNAAQIALEADMEASD